MIALSKPAKLRNAGELEILNDPNIVKGANAYADGFELFAKKLREAGVEGAEDLAANTGRYYVPRKISFEAFAALEQEIGEEGIENLLAGAIAKQQPALNRIDNPIAKAEAVKVKTDDGKTTKISVSKARALATEVIIKAAKYNNKMGGFDIEQLLRIRRPCIIKRIY